MTAQMGWRSEFMAWLFSDYRKRGRHGRLANNSLDAYEQDALDLEHWFKQSQGKPFMPDQMTGEIVEAYFDHLKALKRKPATFNHRLSGIRLLVRWAQMQGLLMIDPTQRIDRMEVEGLPRDKTPEEYETLKIAASAAAHLRHQTGLHQLLGVRDRVIFGLYGQTGLRCSEAAMVDVDDVDLQGLTIRVRHGKGGTDKEVRMPQELAEAITDWLMVRPGSDYGPLITDWDGNRISDGQFRRRLKMIGEAAGVPVTPHDLRHTHGCRLMDSLVQQGLNVHAALDAVRQQLRQKDERTTLGYLRARRSQVMAGVAGAA